MFREDSGGRCGCGNADQLSCEGRIKVKLSFPDRDSIQHRGVAYVTHTSRQSQTNIRLKHGDARRDEFATTSCLL